MSKLGAGRPMSSEGRSRSGSPLSNPNAKMPPSAATTASVTRSLRAFTSGLLGDGRRPCRVGRQCPGGAAEAVDDPEHQYEATHPDPGHERALDGPEHHELGVWADSAVQVEVDVVGRSVEHGRRRDGPPACAEDVEARAQGAHE